MLWISLNHKMQGRCIYIPCCCSVLFWICVTYPGTICVCTIVRPLMYTKQMGPLEFTYWVPILQAIVEYVWHTLMYRKQSVPLDFTYWAPFYKSTCDNCILLFPTNALGRHHSCLGGKRTPPQECFLPLRDWALALLVKAKAAACLSSARSDHEEKDTARLDQP